MAEFTQRLKSGDKLPSHPADTTARKIISFGEVKDARDSYPLAAGLHRNEVDMLKRGEKGGLAYLYRYAIVQDGKDRRIYHTRSRVVIAVECEDADADLQ